MFSEFKVEGMLMLRAEAAERRRAEAAERWRAKGAERLVDAWADQAGWTRLSLQLRTMLVNWLLGQPPGSCSPRQTERLWSELTNQAERLRDEAERCLQEGERR